MPNEALTPRSETTSTTESMMTTSPPERAPSESSSGVHSGEEREEVVIRPRAVGKPQPKLNQPVIQEEPYARSTNMRMSSFNNNNNNSATLPLQRTEHKIDYSHCSTMPLPIGCHNQNQLQQQQQQLYNQQNLSYKSQHGYSNPQSLISSPKQQQLQQPLPSQQQHTTLPNGVRYSNTHFLRRLPQISKAESPYGHLGLGAGHHTFSKLIGQDPLHISIAQTSIPEDRDSANYSMTSEPEYVYATATTNGQQLHHHHHHQIMN